VLLRVLVCADGSVGQILVLEGDRRLAECAVDAVSEWRYEPAHVGGEPVDAYLTLTLDFTL
jgi:outer membrane biosynthesis protein TonB